MKSMHVALRFSEEALLPLHRGLCESPDLHRETILGGQSVDGVETISSFVRGRPSAYESLLTERASVVEYAITPDEEGFFLYLRQELGPEGLSILDTLARDTVVVVPPIEFHSDRTTRMTLVGHPDDLGAVSRSIPEGVTVDVLRVGSGVTPSRTSISERQRDALDVARRVGYFEVPRRNGIATVAAELGCAVSTASELLRRGEAHAVDHLLGTDG